MNAVRQNVSLGSEHLSDLIFPYVRRDYVPLRVDVTIGEALDSLRSQELGEKIVYFYVVDEDGRLEGIVPTRRLLMSDPGVRVSGCPKSCTRALCRCQPGPPFARRATCS
jgi:Mg/Co/Ni transporter MgtE